MPVEPAVCEPDGGGTAEGCCSPSITATPLCLPDGTPILLVLRSDCAACGAEPADPQAAGWIDTSTGHYTPGAAPDGAGPCGSDCATVSQLRLCDHTPDGECVPFWRWIVRDCDGQVTTITDTTVDGVTPYTPAGEVIDCDDCPCPQECHKVVPLCDYQPDGGSVPFLRHLTYQCETGEALERRDTTLDGVTPYTPAGEVGECGECRPAPMCAQLLGLSGPETWTMPEGTESLSINVVCGPVTITDCVGNATVVNECGTGFQWAAPPAECAPGRLCGPFTVEVPEGSAVYVNFLSPCALGDDES